MATLSRLKIEEGKFYRTRSGHKVGPMRRADPRLWNGAYSWEALPPGGILASVWTDDGRFLANGEADDNDLVAEWAGSLEFKVGDRVRVAKGAVLAARPGAIATVTALRGDDMVNVRWDRDNPLRRNQMDGGYFNSVFEKAEPAKPIGSFIVVNVKADGRLAAAANPFIHPTREAAEKEAKRLAELIRGQDFRVYEFNHVSTAYASRPVPPPPAHISRVA